MPMISDPCARHYLDRIPMTPLLTADEEKALATKIRAGCQTSRERMITANLRLVVKIAGGYMRRARSLTLSDLISEGNIGLITAVEKFDPARGCRFSTYAVPWIRQAVGRAIMNTDQNIRVPIHMQEDLVTRRRTAAAMQESLGREPSHQELAARLGWSVHRVVATEQTLPRVVSGDTPIIEGGVGIIDLQPSPAKVDEEVGRAEVAQRLHAWLGELPERSRTALQLAYGFGGIEPLAHERIGELLGVSRSNAHQIHHRAVVALRSFAAAEGLETA